MRFRLARVVVVLLLTAGCGLPLGSGVHAPGDVPAEQRQGGDIQVLPPGPRDDATPEQVVQDFFGAQSNPTDGHASARAFLTPDAAAGWQDSGPVSIYEGSLSTERVAGTAASYRVIGRQVARIDLDGSFTRAAADISLIVQLRRGAHGRWQLSTVPDGLLLSTADRDPSFHPRNVYYLAPPASADRPSTHLVPDRVFFPDGADGADALVRRLLAAPSRDLRSSVTTAFPPGTEVRRVSTDASGLVTVDLSGEVAKASARAQEQMSAQLVWTLRGLANGFAKLRLQSDGRDLRAASGTNLQDHNDWPSYSPDGLPSRAPLYYIAGRRLRMLDSGSSGADEPSTSQVVDEAAVAGRGRLVALVTNGPRGELRTGPFGGPYSLRFRGAALRSPTWGSGEQGVWFLNGSAVWFAPLHGDPVTVPVIGAAAYGGISAIRISRDGARVAVIAGTGSGARLLVGPVTADPADGTPQLGPLRSIAPEVSDVRALSWDSATSLVVLGRSSGVSAPVEVTIDGSVVSLINEVGLERTEPSAVAAAPDRPLVIAAVGVDDGRSVLFRDNGRLYTRDPEVDGYAPFYPD